MSYIVSIGDPFNGLTLYGPFADEQTAFDWAEDHDDNTEYVIVRLQSPAAQEDARRYDEQIRTLDPLT